MHPSAKGNQGITTSHSLSNNPPPLVFIHIRITHNSFPKDLVIITNQSSSHYTRNYCFY